MSKKIYNNIMSSSIYKEKNNQSVNFLRNDSQSNKKFEVQMT